MQFSTVRNPARRVTLDLATVQADPILLGWISDAAQDPRSVTLSELTAFQQRSGLSPQQRSFLALLESSLVSGQVPSQSSDAVPVARTHMITVPHGHCELEAAVASGLPEVLVGQAQVLSGFEELAAAHASATLRSQPLMTLVGKRGHGKTEAATRLAEIVTRFAQPKEGDAAEVPKSSLLIDLDLSDCEDNAGPFAPGGLLDTHLAGRTDAVVRVLAAEGLMQSKPNLAKALLARLTNAEADAYASTWVAWPSSDAKDAKLPRVSFLLDLDVPPGTDPDQATRSALGEPGARLLQSTGCFGLLDAEAMLQYADAALEDLLPTFHLSFTEAARALLGQVLATEHEPLDELGPRLRAFVLRKFDTMPIEQGAEILLDVTTDDEILAAASTSSPRGSFEANQKALIAALTSPQPPRREGSLLFGTPSIVGTVGGAPQFDPRLRMALVQSATDLEAAAASIEAKGPRHPSIGLAIAARKAAALLQRIIKLIDSDRKAGHQGELGPAARAHLGNALDAVMSNERVQALVDGTSDLSEEDVAQVCEVLVPFAQLRSLLSEQQVHISDFDRAIPEVRPGVLLKVTRALATGEWFELPVRAMAGWPLFVTAEGTPLDETSDGDVDLFVKEGASVHHAEVEGALFGPSGASGDPPVSAYSATRPDESGVERLVFIPDEDGIVSVAARASSAANMRLHIETAAWLPEASAVPLSVTIGDDGRWYGAVVTLPGAAVKLSGALPAGTGFLARPHDVISSDATPDVVATKGGQPSATYRLEPRDEDAALLYVAVQGPPGTRFSLSAEHVQDQLLHRSLQGVEALSVVAQAGDTFWVELTDAGTTSIRAYEDGGETPLATISSDGSFTATKDGPVRLQVDGEGRGEVYVGWMRR